MNSKQGIVIIGATSTIAEQCARIWINEAPKRMTLVARDLAKVELIAADLRVRSTRTDVRSVEVNFLDLDEIKVLAKEINKEGPIDIVLIAHGTLPDQWLCQTDLNQCREALEINAISPVLFAESFVEHMEKENSGTLAIISSVAGDRGRKSNYVYGSAKSLVSTYVQGLQHRFAGTNICFVLIKPGPTDTPMTAHLKEQGIQLASAQTVAKIITRGIGRGLKVIYVPARWRVIMAIIKSLPAWLFNRLDV